MIFPKNEKEEDNGRVTTQACLSHNTPPPPSFSLLCFSLLFYPLLSPHYHSREELKLDTLRKGGDDEGSRLRKPACHPTTPLPPLSLFFFSLLFFPFLSSPHYHSREELKRDTLRKEGDDEGSRLRKPACHPTTPLPPLSLFF